MRIILKYSLVAFILVGISFFIMNKNIEYSKIVKTEKKMLKKIYELEENRRYNLYELEKLKRENGYSPSLKKIKVISKDNS